MDGGGEEGDRAECSTELWKRGLVKFMRPYKRDLRQVSSAGVTALLRAPGRQAGAFQSHFSARPR